MTSDKLLATIVSYFPTESLLGLVSDLENQVDHLLIVDNGSGDNAYLKEIKNQAHSWVTILELGTNQGIAKALNMAVAYAQQNNFCYLLTLDQDSRLPTTYVGSMLSTLGKLEQQAIPLGFLAPNFVDINSGTQARFSIISPWWTQTVMCSKAEGIMETHFAITSGTIYPLEIFAQVGNFREDFFIDHVDSEFCLRLASKGYQMFIHCGVCLQHAIGNRTVHKFLGLTIKPNNHRALRRYYIARNGIYLALRYFSFSPAYTWLALLRLIHEVLSVALYEKERPEKLKMLARGLIHGLRGKLGAWSG